MTDRSWWERLELGLKVANELGEHWTAGSDEYFFKRLGLAATLTEALGMDWVAIFCHVEKAGPISGAEISGMLKLDQDVVTRCVKRLEEEGLIEQASVEGGYVLAVQKHL